MGKLTADSARLEARLADPATYSGPAAEVAKLQKDLGDLKKRLAAAEDDWLEALEALEAAAAEQGG